MFKEVKDKLENNCMEQETIKSSCLIFFLVEPLKLSNAITKIKNLVDDFNMLEERIKYHR